MIVEITIYPKLKSDKANMYVATFIHQQLVGNSNYINSAIIVNCDTRDNDTYSTIINIDPSKLDKHIPNIAIDWQTISHIEIEVIDPDIDTTDKIIDSINSSYNKYPTIVGYHLSIGYLGSDKIDLEVNNIPYMVFNIADWFKEED